MTAMMRNRFWQLYWELMQLFPPKNRRISIILFKRKSEVLEVIGNNVIWFNNKKIGEMK